MADQPDHVTLTVLDVAAKGVAPVERAGELGEMSVRVVADVCVTETEHVIPVPQALRTWLVV